MSPQSRAAGETTPLLDDSPSLRRSSVSLSWEGPRVSPEILLIPVVLAARLGSAIPSATLFELLRQTVCRLSNTLHGHPASLARGSCTPPQFCDSPRVVWDFAIAIAMVSVIGGIISMVGCAMRIHISLYYGRKPAFLFVLLMGITWSCLIAGSKFMPDGPADWIFLAGMLLHILSNSLPYGHLVNMYVVDVCHPKERSATLRKIRRWGALGACISFALGGFITTKTGNPLIVFCMAATIFVAASIYVVFVLPKTTPETRQDTLLKHSNHTTSHRLLSLHTFQPLMILIPNRTLGGTRNWRLAQCALHVILYTIVNAHPSSARFVFVISKYHLTPADTGLFLTTAAASSVIVLKLIVPLLVHGLRPYYSRTMTRFSLKARQTSALETSDDLNVHLAFISCLIGPISSLCAASSRTRLTLMLSCILGGFSAIHDPMVRKLVAGSVDPLKQGEALAAIEMVHSAARVLSPIIMGGIFTAVTPLLLFYVHLVVVLISAGLLLLVRDSDRFHELNEV